LLVVLPIALLSTRGPSSPASARASRQTPQPSQPSSARLAATPLRERIAPLAPAIAGHSSLSSLMTSPSGVPARSPGVASSAQMVLRGAETTGGGPAATRGLGTDPVAGRSDLQAMQKALQRWKEAYESRDVAAVSRAWPTISSTQARSLDTAFDKMTQMTVLFRQCSLAGSIVRGSATCRVERSIRFKSGRTETFPSQVAFQLEKRADKWVIIGVRGA